MKYKTFTSESVSCGHPDKICDQISDSILDEAIKIYPRSRVAVETLVTKNHVTIAGEVTCPKKLNYKKIAREVIKDLGYTKKIYSFTYNSPIDVFVHEQSPDISIGVDNQGAGDQGMMFGYACSETKELMPLPIILSHRLAEALDRLKNRFQFLRPDGKTEVKIVYKNGKPKYLERVVFAVPHNLQITNSELKIFLIEKVLIPVLEKYNLAPPKKKNITVNGTGIWEIGGPASDTGVTGRKIIVDTYGGMSRHGGGCFSGKDPTKVDRSAAYAARFIAKNVVSHGLADRCEMQISYVIGKKEPLGKEIETFCTEKKDRKKVEKFAFSLLDLSVPAIIKGLNLLRPIYRKTAVYGHFGRDSFPWEKVVK